MNQSKLAVTILLFVQASNAMLGGRMLRERDPQGPSRGVVMVEMMRGDYPVAVCTGTVIARNVVLTAAHCFDENLVPGVTSFYIVLDSFQDGGSFQKAFPGTRVESHPGYIPYNKRKPEFLQNDIALAFFEGQLPADIQPVPIDQDTSASYKNRAVEVYGYGRSIDYTGKKDEKGSFSSGVLRYATLQVSNYEYRQFPKYYMTEANPKVPTYLCQGDSGGPQFIVNRNGDFKQIGVNSGGGIPKADGSGIMTCKSAGSVTKVAPAARWILETMKGY